MLALFDLFAPFAGTTGGGDVSAPPAPVITSIAPSSGPVGTVVTISGTNLTGVALTLGLFGVAYTGNATTITATVPASATNRAFFAQSLAGVGVSTLFTVTRVAPPASTVTLRWVLDAFPAVQTTTDARVLLRESRNAIVVRDVVNAETDRYVTPTGITWALVDGADALLSGAFAVSGDGWRAEIILDPSVQFGAPPVLSVTATLGGATWTRDYPIILTERA